MIRRSAAVAIAVTLQVLAAGKTGAWSDDQELVLAALRRSKTSLNYASDEELGEYVRGMSTEQLSGLASNVKGIFHEMLVRRAENTDGDAITAEIFEALNHPGADLEFFVDGTVVQEVQVKAVQDPLAILTHFSKYPNVDVMATSEAYEALAGAYQGRVSDSGFSNEEISMATRETLEQLAGESLGDLIQNGVLTSILVAGALQAKATLSGQAVDGREVRSFLELAGIGAVTAVTVDALLNLV
jgi:hypothetical protein